MGQWDISFIIFKSMGGRARGVKRMVALERYRESCNQIDRHSSAQNVNVDLAETIF